MAFTYAHATEQAQQLVAELGATGHRAQAIRADSGDPAAIRAAVAQVGEAFGRIDVLVNNADIIVAGAVDDTTVN